MSVFAQFRSYGFIHHRALNDFAALAQARATVKNFPGRVHVYEGDICWNFEGGREDLYFRHPSYVFDTLTPQKTDTLKRAGSLVTLDDLEALVGDDAYLVIELKVGRGSAERALTRLVQFLERHFPQRYWIDGFSTTLLRQVKAIHPGVTLTLHTEAVLGQSVIAAAPQQPRFRVVPLAELSFIDGIALRWRFGTDYMARAARTIRAAGKSLLVSRIHTLEQFDRSVAWQASAGYPHTDFAVLAARYDELAGEQGGFQAKTV